MLTKAKREKKEKTEYCSEIEYLTEVQIERRGTRPGSKGAGIIWCNLQYA